MKLVVSNSLTGLGNRLENIISIYRIAILNKCHFNFFWHKNEWSIRPYNELFSTLHGNLIEQLPIITSREQYKNCLIYEPKRPVSEELDELNKYDIVLFNTDGVVLNQKEDCLYYLYKYAQILKPSVKVKCYSNIVLNKYDMSKIPAIHVRCGVKGRTEKKDLSARNPPLIYEYDNYIDKNFTGQFFLSSDDNLVKDRYIDKYKDRVITLPTTDDYNEEYFCIHSLSDMYIMSLCSEIVGSQSSFNRFASLWGIKKRTILYHEKEDVILNPENFLDFS